MPGDPGPAGTCPWLQADSAVQGHTRTSHRPAAEGVQQGRVHAGLSRPLARGPAGVVRHGPVRQPDQGGRLPCAQADRGTGGLAGALGPVERWHGPRCVAARGRSGRRARRRCRRHPRGRVCWPGPAAAVAVPVDGGREGAGDGTGGGRVAPAHPCAADGFLPQRALRDDALGPNAVECLAINRTGSPKTSGAEQTHRRPADRRALQPGSLLARPEGGLQRSPAHRVRGSRHPLRRPPADRGRPRHARLRPRRSTAQEGPARPSRGKQTSGAGTVSYQR